jgi:aminoglycoside phosphotransferase (APT) family kinase protein
MSRDCVSAVLTPWQLEKFCRLFGLQPSELEANFDGWHKHVLMSKDKVFLFPRSPEFAGEVKRELAFYERFSHLGSVALPKVVRRIKDREISYYEFGAVTRLSGIPFSRFLNEISLDQFEKLLGDLAEIIAVWHSIPKNELPEFLSGPTKTAPKRTTVGNWHKKVLSPETTEEAVDFIYRFIRRLSATGSLPQTIAREVDTKARWAAAMRELAGLSDVLVHGDLHEDHILVESPSLRITGIVDWETARIGNPVWDFNFGEWGLGICQWWDKLVALRRGMWQRYLEARSISLSTAEGLNLFYILWDMIWLLYKRRDNEKHMPIPTGVGFENSVRIYLDKLSAVTALLQA